ncbi:hypothetical protein V8B97DRAFT_670349 [Scleroderma yunnanense]
MLLLVLHLINALRKIHSDEKQYLPLNGSLLDFLFICGQCTRDGAVVCYISTYLPSCLSIWTYPRESMHVQGTL